MVDKPTEKQVPANLEAEEAVLGSLLIDPDVAIEVAPLLAQADFYREKNGMIYRAILDLHERREPADVVTVTNELERQNTLAEVGGVGYLMGLVGKVASPAYAKHYAKIVVDMATLRALIGVAGQITQAAYDAPSDVEEVVDRAESLVFSVSNRTRKRDVEPVSTVLGGVVERLDYLQRHQGEVMGVPTGFAGLDKLLGGMQKSDLILLAGRPSTGKSAAALNIIKAATKRYGKVGALFSLEMSNEQLGQRLIASETGISVTRMRQGGVNDNEWLLVIQATAELSDCKLFFDDTPAISINELRAKARRIQAEYGLDLLVIDYLQLMRSDERGANREQQVATISRGLKALARELDIPVLALAQLSRASEVRSDHRPVLSDLRETGSLEQEADVILFLYSEEKNDPNTDRKNIVDVIVAKHRNGPCDTIPLYFDGATTTFRDLEVNRHPLDYGAPAAAKPAPRNSHTEPLYPTKDE